jgi:mRNA-degrading endonuclease RelE of RelBE toxin-antitoxin system
MPEVVYADSFFKAAARLQKRYPHIEEDAEKLADRLEAGELPGDRIQGLPYRVYKARIRNSDARRGKSGGYRMIYYLETGDKRIIIFIYSKTDQSDIPVETIRRFITEYEDGKP